MATIYRILSADRYGRSWISEIDDPGFSGTVTTFKGARKPFEIYWKGNRKNTKYRGWARAYAKATIRFVDEANGAARSLFSGSDNYYKLTIRESSGSGITAFEGFVAPAQYGFTSYKRDISGITATDNLKALDRIFYFQDDGNPYSGDDRVIHILHRLLKRTGLVLPIKESSRYCPYTALNPLSDLDGFLYRLHLNQDHFYKEDGTSYSCGYLLDQILQKLRLRVFYWDGAWHITHRRREVTAGQFDQYEYTPDGEDLIFEGITPADYAMAIDGADYQFRAHPRGSGLVPFRSVSNVYVHENSTVPLLENLGFEDGILTAGVQAGTWSRVGSASIISSTAQAASGDTSLRLTPAYQTDVGQPIENYSDTYVFQESAQQIGGGLRLRLRLRFKYYLESLGTNFSALNLLFKIIVDGHYAQLGSPPWTETDVTFTPSLGAPTVGAWTQAEYSTEFLVDADNIHFDPSVARLEIHQPVVSYSPDGSGIGNLYYDDLEFDLVDAGATETYIPQSISRFRATLTTSNNLTVSEEPQFIIGEGPTTAHAGTFKVQDAVGTLRPLATGWSWLAPPADQNICLEQFIAREELREYSGPIFTLRGSIIDRTGSGVISPLQWMQVADPGAGPLRTFTWEEFTFRPCNSENIATVFLEEFVQGAEADLLERESFEDSVTTQFGLGFTPTGETSAGGGNTGGGLELPPFEEVFDIPNNLGRNLIEEG